MILERIASSSAYLHLRTSLLHACVLVRGRIFRRETSCAHVVAVSTLRRVRYLFINPIVVDWIVSKFLSTLYVRFITS